MKEQLLTEKERKILNEFTFIMMYINFLLGLIIIIKGVLKWILKISEL